MACYFYYYYYYKNIFGSDLMMPPQVQPGFDRFFGLIKKKKEKTSAMACVTVLTGWSRLLALARSCSH